MSLSIAALRLATVKSLDGKTSAGDRVFDSVVDPLDLLGKAAAPTIVVLTDTGNSKIEGRDLLGAASEVDLVIEFFVASATRVTVPVEDGASGETETHEVIVYPATDAGFENLLRRLAWEVATILSGSKDPWPELWRRAAVTVKSADWDRGGDAKAGARFNFLRVTYRVEPIADPIRGEELIEGYFWKEFLDTADADDELSDLAKDWRALITTPDLPAWRVAASALGLTAAELRGVGLAPFAGHVTGVAESARLVSITLDPVGETPEALPPPE